mmetsp:Transcript_65118/g.196509  ORF Transcript_65118/g.196509 Transcript_65118/m.196509 type:complete len:1034 (+) Transcript_65118:74-3175(+)
MSFRKISLVLLFLAVVSAVILFESAIITLQLPLPCNHGAELEGKHRYAPAPRNGERALVLWPTVPVPTLKGSDVRILQTITVLLQMGFDVDLAYFEEIEDELRRESVQVPDSTPHFASLRELGVQRIVGPLSKSGLQRTALSGHQLLVYWLWPNPDYLECLTETSKYVKQANGMATVVAVSDDAGLAFRALVGNFPSEPVPVLRRAILHDRPEEFVGTDVEPNGNDLPAIPNPIRTVLRYEMKIYCCHADVLVGISPAVTDVLSAMVPGKPTVVLPYAMHVQQREARPQFAERKDFAFFGYTNTANNAGVAWFLQHVFPLLNGGHTMHILGSVKTRACSCTSSACTSTMARVVCHGAVSDDELDRIIGTIRATVNPALEPAGVATKTLRSLSLGTPVVTTEHDGTFTKRLRTKGARVCPAKDAACFARELDALLGSEGAWAPAAEDGPSFVRSNYTMDAFRGAWNHILQMRHSKRLSVVIQGEARKHGESMQAQMWHMAHTLSLSSSLNVTIIGGMDPAIPRVGSVPVSQAPFPTGFQANVVIRQNWPPILEPPPMRYCGPGCRVATILPWEFGSLPEKWVPYLRHFTDQLWAPSEYNRQIYINSGIEAIRTVTVPCGIDCEALEAAARKPRRASSAATFIFSGGLLPRKGVDILLSGWDRAFCRGNFDAQSVRLVIHTSYELGYAREDHRKMRIIMDRCSNVEWIRGKWLERGEYLQMMRDADVYVAPFRSEGFGLPIVEAMAMGLSVVTSVGGTSADDYFSTQVGYPVSTKRAPCLHFPCSSNGQLCVFPPCEPGKGCTCEDLVEPAWYFEPSTEHLKAQLLQVAQDVSSGRKGGQGNAVVDQGIAADKARAAQHYVKPLYCWANQQGRYVNLVQATARSSSQRWLQNMQGHALVLLADGNAPFDGRSSLRSDEAIPFLSNGPFTAKMQEDGNFVVYKFGSEVMFGTDTGSSCPCTLALRPCAVQLLDKYGKDYYTTAEICDEAFGRVFSLVLEQDGSLLLKQGMSPLTQSMLTVHRFDWLRDGVTHAGGR